MTRALLTLLLLAPLASAVAGEPARASGQPRLTTKRQFAAESGVDTETLDTSQPVKIELEAAESAVIGDRYTIQVRTLAGKPNSYTWKVLPEGTKGLRLVAGGSIGDFTNRKPDTYVFIVGAHGADGSGDVAYHTLHWQYAEADRPAPAMQRPPIQTMPPEARARPTVEGVLEQLTANVRSNNKQIEQVIWANAFRSVAAAQDRHEVTGDNLAAVRSIASKRLSPSLGAWRDWYAGIKDMLGQMQQPDALGRVATVRPEEFAAVDNRIAAVLEGGR